jgi:hypothetical protein
MSDARDEQDIAEAFDPDELALGDDPEYEAGYDDPERGYAPERPLGANQYGTTTAEERVPESLEDYVRREVRDPLDDIEEPGADELVAIEAEELLEDEDSFDEAESDIDVDDEIERERPVGRLVGPGADDDGEDLEDDEPDAVASSVEEDDLSAEEEAVHLTGDPPFDDDDGYVDD